MSSRIVWVIIVGVLAAAGGFATGYLVRGSSPGSASSASNTLSITAAGTLGTLFPQVARELVNTTPGVSAPIASQQYEGSLAALSAISQLHEPFDVAAAADFRLIPQMLEPNFTSWEAVFASTPEALVYDPTLSVFQGVNTTNWPAKLTSPGVVLGVANQSTDPNGYNGIFVLELQGALQGEGLGSIYGHFFTTPVGGLAEPSSTTTRVEPETQVATLIQQHAVSAFITYRSYAIAHSLSYVNFDPKVGLGSTDPSALSFYANASTSILGSNGNLVSVKGAPVLFAATVPSNAPNPTLGDEFLDLLCSPAGAALISAGGFTPISPAWLAGSAGSTPSILAPDVEPIPGALAAYLP